MKLKVNKLTFKHQMNMKLKMLLIHQIKHFLPKTTTKKYRSTFHQKHIMNKKQRNQNLKISLIIVLL